MQSKLLFLAALLIFGCDEQVIRLDIAGEFCRGAINDAGECIASDRHDSDHNDRDGRGECEGIEKVLTYCIENLGADDPECIELQKRFDDEC